MDELTGVINLYPWFGGARKELCARMAKVGGSEWGKAQYSDTAMYVVSRTLITGIMRSARREDYSDKDVERLIKEYIRSDSGALRQAQDRTPYRRSLDRSVLPDNPFRPLGGQTRSLSLSKRRERTGSGGRNTGIFISGTGVSPHSACRRRRFLLSGAVCRREEGRGQCLLQLQIRTL